MNTGSILSLWKEKNKFSFYLFSLEDDGVPYDVIVNSEREGVESGWLVEIRGIRKPLGGIVGVEAFSPTAVRKFNQICEGFTKTWAEQNEALLAVSEIIRKNNEVYAYRRQIQIDEKKLEKQKSHLHKVSLELSEMQATTTSQSRG